MCNDRVDKIVTKHMPKDSLLVSEEWQFSHPPSYVITWKGLPLYGNIRKQLQGAAKQSRIEQYWAMSMANSESQQAVADSSRQAATKYEHMGNMWSDAN